MHITVLMGSDSPEREISLQTGAAVAAALERGGHTVTRLDIPDTQSVVANPAIAEADLVFPALHGGHGEDGHLQALLDLMGITYALSGPLASALAMDKAAAKRVMAGAGIVTPEWLQVTWDRAIAGPVALSGSEVPETERCGEVLSLDRVLERAGGELGFPLVVKLNGAGSSVGVEIVASPGGFDEAFRRVAGATVGSQAGIILERFIPGRERTAAILLGRRLPLLEISPREGFYDYDNKYTKGATEYLVPAPVHSPLYETICADALQLYDLLGCRGVARVDFRLDDDHHYCLEINTIPGMTELSLVPMAAAAVGISFEALVEDLCRDALLQAGRTQ